MIQHYKDLAKIYMELLKDNDRNDCPNICIQYFFSLSTFYKNMQPT